MMVGIGLGIMVILCAVGLIGGGFFMHHEWKDPKNQPVIQQSHDHGQAADPLPGDQQEGQKTIDEP